MRYHDSYMHAGDGPHVLAWLVLVLLLILVAGLIAAVAARWGGLRRTAMPAVRPGDDPLELVRLRYARGEIDRETFLQASADLGGRTAAPG